MSLELDSDSNYDDDESGYESDSFTSAEADGQDETTNLENQNSDNKNAEDDISSASSSSQKPKSLRASLSEEFEKATAARKAQQAARNGKFSGPAGDLGAKTAAGQQPPFRVPQSWSKEAREWLTAQPKTVEEAIELRKKIAEYAAKRQEDQERDYTSKTTQLAREREAFQRQAQTLDSVYRTIAPKMQEFALRGVDPGVWLREVMALDELARKDKRAALNHLINQWGIDPREVLQQQQQSSVPPEVIQPMRQMYQEIQSLKQAEAAKQQAVQQQRFAYNQREVENFLTAADESGNPLHPFAERVAEDMELIVAKIAKQQPTRPAADILKEAYDKAVWANPETRAELQEQMQQQKAQKEREEAAKRVAGARRAASPIVSSPNGQVMPTKRSLREELELSYDELART